MKTVAKTGKIYDVYYFHGVINFVATDSHEVTTKWQISLNSIY